MPIRKPGIALFLAVLLAAVPCMGAYVPAALAQETDEAPTADEVELILDTQADTVRFVGQCRVALKMRKSPSLTANGVGGLAINTDVYIMSMDADWARVVKNDTIIGYVQSKYLENIRHYDPVTKEVGDIVNFVGAVPAPIYSENGFARRFVGYAVVRTPIYEQPSKESKILTRIEIYEQLYVNEFRDDGWAYCEYKNHFGYIPTDNLFKFDRIDPYAGDIPGCIVYPLMATVKKTTDILAVEDDKVLKTIFPGAMICVEEPDEKGRYRTPYYRTTGYITQDDIYQLWRVVPYDKAEPGDLVSVMTTYYALGITTLEYQGRNWNIYLSGTLLSGILLKKGEQLNVNEVIGPYRASTGYKPAPITGGSGIGYGGGTCQVNTTLYNVLIQVPILVNFRQVHANVGTYYFLKGFDAAVGSRDSINMIFTNTMPYDIRINYLISDGALTVCIFRA